MLLAVNLIVKDEAAHIEACLASVRDLADEVVVYDTGSRDDTMAIARAAGAIVIEGYWDDDFARARNAVLDATAATWVLSLDADERWAAPAEPLRETLRSAPPGVGYAVTIRNLAPDELGGDFEHRGARLFRREGTRWVGHVHEVPRGPRIRRSVDISSDVARLLHLGYGNRVALVDKSSRNAVLAQAELDRLLAERSDDGLRIAGVLLDLGRSLFGAGRKQEAVEAFEALRELAPGTQHWIEATDFLARLLAMEQYHEVVLVLVDQLRGVGVEPGYCAWLAAPALCHLGRPAEALPALRAIGSLVDPGGREYDLGRVHELRSLVAALCGERREALEALVAAMSGHGRVRGRGSVLVDLARGAETEAVALIRSCRSEFEREVLAELQRQGERGHPLLSALGSARELDAAA